VTGVDAVARRVQDAFSAAPRRERLHVSGRLRTCPIADLSATVPTNGRILDFGCGHGAVALYLALSGPDRSVTGVDVDAEKLVHARDAAGAVGASIEFVEVAPDYLPTGEWDAITIVDVLYLLGPTLIGEVIASAAGALVPGGTLLVKELDVSPRWKFRVAVAQEVLATKVLRITEGSTLHWESSAELGRRMTDAGLVVEQRPLHHGRVHPHHLVIGRKPA
jgi:2-polyprenyl-3-methyl-5-hydroxy-6-metoxy-1,4-benzoquinol methylase